MTLMMVLMIIYDADDDGDGDDAGDDDDAVQFYSLMSLTGCIHPSRHRLYV